MFIYLHLPFCNSICSYCDFPKMLYDKKYIQPYLKELEKEIKKRYQGEFVKSIFIGGGTPTCLTIDELEQLLKLTNLFHKKEKIELTIESNIESLSLEKIKLLKKYGVNRVSLGVQSFRENILTELNRKHKVWMIKKVIEELKNEGINNISIDYIYGVDSNIDGVSFDIEYFFSLEIPHISCYSLIIEDGTMMKIKKKEYIDDETDEKMYQLIEKKLEEKGYIHYEISNYAKENYQSIHNLNYWENGDYYGFGLGAVSYLNHIRRTNTRNLSNYLKGNIIKEEELEDLDTRISNEFILGLRKIQGISISKFKEKYHKEIFDCYDVKELLKEGLLTIEEDNLKITKEFIYLSNSILVHFL